MLAESAADLSAHLDNFDMPHVEVETEVDQANCGYGEVEVIEESEYDARVGRIDNYTETEDVCLIPAWESVSLDALPGKEQRYGNYWQRIEEKYHQIILFPYGSTLKSLQGRWDIINKTCSCWSGCLEQVRNAHPSGITIDGYVSVSSFSWLRLS
ncbi:hypothetical protein D1007_13563 [Hordeum vulgare]|nr:hypothetical protein D1007_13563 [Hordeum vulgare]